MSAPPIARDKGIWTLIILSAACLLAVILVAWLAGEQLVGLEMDDPWYMWFAWRLAHGHLTDPLFGAAGPQLFGRVWIWLLSKAYAVGGWRLAAGHAVSLSCLIAAAAIWLRLGRRLGLRLEQAVLLAVTLVAYYPFLRAGLSARPEAFIWFLTSLAMLVLDARQPFLAGVLAGVAAETHPMGLVALVYLGAWIWRMRPSWGIKRTLRSLLWLFAGLAIASLSYLAVHGAYLLALLSGEVTSGFAAMMSFRTPVLAYLDSGDVLRRASAALLIVASLSVYVATGSWRREKLPLYLLVAIGVLFVIVPRANELYFVYFAPILLLALIVSLSSPLAQLAAFLTITLPCLGIYAVFAFANRGYSEMAMEQALGHELAGTGEPVLTTSIFWPALRCQASMASIQDFPEMIRGGGSFYVLLQNGQDLALNFPRDTTIRHVRLSPRADFFVYHVHPRAARAATSLAYPDCPGGAQALPSR
jgi:hypothetical protein